MSITGSPGWPWEPQEGWKEQICDQQDVRKTPQAPQPWPRLRMGFQPLVPAGMDHVMCCDSRGSSAFLSRISVCSDRWGWTGHHHLQLLYLRAPGSLSPADVAISNSWLCSWFLPSNSFFWGQKWVVTPWKWELIAHRSTAPQGLLHLCSWQNEGGKDNKNLFGTA